MSDYRNRPGLDEPRIVWLNWWVIAGAVLGWPVVFALVYLVCVAAGKAG